MVNPELQDPVQEILAKLDDPIALGHGASEKHLSTAYRNYGDVCRRAPHLIPSGEIPGRVLEAAMRLFRDLQPFGRCRGTFSP
jgi:hypothetical protein